jgi:hydrogenase maturation protein HypF
MLLEQSILALRHSGYRAYWHQRVPTNDGGIALGQVNAARIFRYSH